MQKLSFIKGLTIGTFFSAFFWIGAYQAVTSLTRNDISQEQNIENFDVTSDVARIRTNF
jgi:uncharacterized membrane protein YciS (DUF1049 family)